MASTDYSMWLLVVLLTRICRLCNERKLLTDFPRDNRLQSGHTSRCKQCVAQKYQGYYEQNREAILTKNRAYTRIQWLPILQHKRHYAAQHRLQYRAADQKYQRKNPAKMCLRQARRRARARGLPDTLHDAHERFAYQYWHYMCAVCGRENGLWHSIVLDHWIPIADPACPGTVPENMVPLCHSKKDAPPDQPGCNHRKGAKHPLEWLQTIFSQKRAQKKWQDIQTFLCTATHYAITDEHAAAGDSPPNY